MEQICKNSRISQPFQEYSIYSTPLPGDHADMERCLWDARNLGAGVISDAHLKIFGVKSILLALDPGDRFFPTARPTRSSHSLLAGLSFGSPLPLSPSPLAMWRTQPSPVIVIAPFSLLANTFFTVSRSSYRRRRRPIQ